MVPLKDAPRAAPDGRRSNWGLIAGIVLGLVLVPLAFAARVDTQVVLAPEINADPGHYLTAMGFAIVFHLILLTLMIVALAQRFRHRFVNVIVLEMLVGYGLASLMFATLIH